MKIARRMLVMIVMLCCAGLATASYTFTDDFESYANDSVWDGQGGWDVELSPAGYWSKISSDNTPAHDGQTAMMVTHPGLAGHITHAISPDEDILSASFVYLPNDNGGGWGDAHMWLEDDAGDYYFYAWFQLGDTLNFATAHSAVWTGLGAPGEQPFRMDIEIDFAQGQQKVVMTPLISGSPVDSGWHYFQTGHTPTLATAGNGTFHIQTTYGGLDDVSFVSTPEPATLCLLGLGGLVLRRRRK